MYNHPESLNLPNLDETLRVAMVICRQVPTFDRLQWRLVEVQYWTVHYLRISYLPLWGYYRLVF